MAKKIGYIRVPKTGSSLITDYLRYEQGNYIVYGVSHLPYTVLSQMTNIDEYFSFVRDPLQLYSSFYFFMKKRIFGNEKKYNPLAYTEQSEYNIDIIESGADLEYFLLNCPKNQMLSYFIDPFPLEELKFIGIIEKMNDSILLFNKIFNLNLQNKLVNINKDKIFNDKYIVSEKVKNKFEKRNEREYEIYKKSIEIFNKNIYLNT